MRQNINIEAEGNELVLKNKAGDYVIIPKKYRTEVQGMIKDNCHGCIDKLVDTLPVMEDYAQDGSLYSEYLTTDPPTKKHPLNPNPDGNLPSYFKGSDANPIQLGEITVTAEAPDWLKYRREYVKNNPFNIDEYVENRFNNPIGRENIKKIDQEGWKKKLRQEGLEQRYNSAMDYVGEQLIKNKPQGNLSRVEWLNQMSDKEEEIIKRNPKYQSSLWADTKRGLTSLVEQNPLQTFQNILNSSDYTNREKQEMLKDYTDHPIMSKLGDTAKILNPLTVPSKMVQSAYKDDYSFTDSLKGKKNNAGIVEDIVTDPLNLVGVGLASKLSKADKVIDATKIGSKVLNKTDDVVRPIVSSVDDVGKQATKPTWQMEELPGLHLKSTMEGQAISKIVEPKTGLVNVEQALGIIGKESGGADKVALIKQGLGENIPKKMDYNEFRKVVQNQLIPLERQFATHSSDYGVNRLGYYKKGQVPKYSESYLNQEIDKINKILKSSEKGEIKIPHSEIEGLKNKLADYERHLSGNSFPEYIENQTLILGNKNKFGRGSSAHSNPEETLGHIHFLRDAETPDVLTVTQIQSDAFQGTHRVGAKTKEQAKFSYERQLEYYNKNKEKLEGITQLPDGSYQFADGQKISKGAYENMFSGIEESVNLSKTELENFTQKQLLDKNHQERYLQELVDYAGKRGDINKVRVPTSETAAKVQGYTKTYSNDLQKEITKLKEERLKTASKEGIYSDKFKNLDEQIKILELNNEKKYLPEHQTILKKYSEQPKTIKKLFGVEPKVVTDSKGNTWYEFDIPKKFKEGKGEIKAFTVVPAAIGTGAAIQSQNQNKTEQ